MLPIRAPPTPMQNPSITNMLRIFPGRVPMAAIVPISLIRSYTAMIITFMMLIRTMAMSMSLMKKVITSIIRAMLKKGESFSQVWTSKRGLPCG